MAKKNKGARIPKAPNQKLNRKKLKSSISEAFAKEPSVSLNYKQIAARLGIENPHDRELLVKELSTMRASGMLKEVSRGKYKISRPDTYVTGRIDLTQSGSAYVKVPGSDMDIFIPPRFVGQALQDDLVKVFIWAQKKGKKQEGQIVEIIERSRTRFVGTVEISEDFAFLVPDSKKMLVDLYIPLDKLNGAKNGEKAIAELTRWPKEASSPFGQIVEVLGEKGSSNVEIQSILAENGFPTRFPEHVEAIAAKIPLDISDEEIAKRIDFRDITTFTIDPFDAKDFDDAISFKKLENGNYQIGVHIADVTHYVKEGDEVDNEAVNRATSVYLVDRVIPMLPEVLSNGVCSLRPNEDKLCYAAIFEIDEEAKVHKSKIARTIIHSNRRFTYEEAQEIIEKGEGEFAEELSILNNLAITLRKKRLNEGAIAFDRIEVRFKLNADGLPETVVFKVQKEAHKLIEEFMLMANRTVAAFVGETKKEQKPKPFVYRIHDEPDPQKLADFSAFTKKFGYNYKFSSPGLVPKSMNELLQEIQGKREENLLETLAIRTMAKAEYSTDNIGHYGLGFKYYTHFTSPIRRYPDMMVHRLLTHYLSGGKPVNANQYEKLCEHSSTMERKAADAERQSTKYFQVLYLKDSIGEVFDGVISGVTEWGIYVEIADNKCEGMIRLRDIAGDYYFFDEKNYRIIGHNHNRIFQLGDPIKIRLKNVDLANKQIDFELLDMD
jgi:ribonuclease R